MSNLKEFDKKFNAECERILIELYHNPMEMGNTEIRRVQIKTEKRYIDYLVAEKLIKNLNIGVSGNFSIDLDRKGFEVFEKYNGFKDYKKRIIDKELKIENAKRMATKFWWLPIVISVAAFIISLLGIYIKMFGTPFCVK